MEVLDRFTTDIERLANEQRDLSKAWAQAKRAAGKADAAVAKLHKRIADLEEQKQVCRDCRTRYVSVHRRSMPRKVHAADAADVSIRRAQVVATCPLQSVLGCNPHCYRPHSPPSGYGPLVRKACWRGAAG